MQEISNIPGGKVSWNFLKYIAIGVFSFCTLSSSVAFAAAQFSETLPVSHRDRIDLPALQLFTLGGFNANVKSIVHDLPRAVARVRESTRPALGSIPTDLSSGITISDTLPELAFVFPEIPSLDISISKSFTFVVHVPNTQNVNVPGAESREIGVAGLGISLIGEFVPSRFIPRVLTGDAFLANTATAYIPKIAAMKMPRIAQAGLLPALHLSSAQENRAGMVLGASIANVPQIGRKTSLPFLDRLSLTLYCALEYSSGKVDQRRCDYDALAGGNAGPLPAPEKEIATEVSVPTVPTATTTASLDSLALALASKIAQAPVYITKYVTEYIDVPGPAGRDGRDGKDGSSGIMAINNVQAPVGFGSYIIPSNTSPSTSLGISTISYLKDTTIEMPTITGGTALNLSLATPTLRNATFNGFTLFNDSALFGGYVTVNNLTATSSTFLNATTTNAYTTNSTTTNAYVQSFVADTAQVDGTLAVVGTSTFATTTATDFTASRATTTSLYSILFGAMTGFITNLTVTDATTTNATTTNAYIANLSVGTSTANSMVLTGTLAVVGTSTLATTTATDFTASRATSTSFFSTLLTAVNGFITNLTATNATSTNLFAANSVLTNSTSTNLFTQNLAVGNASTTGNQSIDGMFMVSGTSTLGANVYLNGSVTIGTSSNNMLTVNALVNSHVVPAQNIMYDLGSPSFYWRNGYLNTLNVNTLSAASTTISGTANSSFTINSGNGTPDTQDSSLIFFRGLTTPNGVLRWNSVTKRLESNMSFQVYNETPTTGTTTLTVKSGASQGAFNLFELISNADNKLSVFNANGWLGIGSSTPGSALTVIGDAYLGGNITATGTLAVTGTSTLATTTLSLTNVTGDILPTTDIVRSLGSNVFRFLNLFSQNLYASSSQITNASSTGLTATNVYATLLTTAGTTTFATSGGFVGIGTTTPQTSLHIATTDGLIIPVGTTAQRPSATLAGIIRYNTSNTTFEGFNGSTWGSLGGVIDTDQDTYVSAENSPGADNDELKFTTGGVLRGIISAIGNWGVGTSTPTSLLTVASSTATGASSLFSVGTTTTLFNILANGNVGIGTSTPGYKFSLTGSGSTGAALARFAAGNGNSYTQINDNGTIIIDSDASSGTYPVTVKYNGTTNAFVGYAGDFRGTYFGSMKASSDTPNPNGTNGYFGHAGGYWQVRDSTSHAINFDVYNSGSQLAAMTIAQNGNVGIGTTSPVSLLSVMASGTAQTSPFISFNSTTSPIFNVLANGNVGVGSSTPYAKLALAGGNFIQTASNPVLASTTATTNVANAVFVSGRYAYVVENSATAGLQIYDIVNPASPSLVSSFNTQDIPRDVIVSGKYAYILERNTTKGLEIVDISNAATPVSLGSVHLSVGTGVALRMYLSGKYVYVVGNESFGATPGFSIVDVSDPTAPMERGTLTLNASGSATVAGVYVSGKYAYIAQGKTTGGLTIVDISNSSAPKVVGTGNTTNLATAVHVSGKYAYVGEIVAASGLEIFDISNATSPTLVSTFVTANNIGTLGTTIAGRIMVAGNYAYLVENGTTDGVEVVDISNAITPVRVGSYTTPSVNKGAYLSGKYLYLAGGTAASGFSVLDVSGANLPTANIGNLAAGELNVDNNSVFGGDLYAQGGLSVGISGIFSRGTISAYVASSTQTNAVVANFMGGNVGIGTTTPTSLLSVIASSTAPTSPFISFNSTTSPIFNVLANGNVGIGTSTPSSALQVTASTSVSTFATATKLGFFELYNTNTLPNFYSGIDFTSAYGGGGTYPKARIAMKADSTGSYLSFGTTGNWTNGINNSAITINPTGNVSIGTTATTSTLTVGGNIQLQGGRIYGRDLTEAYIEPYNTSTGDITFFSTYPTAGINFNVANNATARVRIDSSGNVGIGTTSPISLLSVMASSTAQTSSFISFNSTTSPIFNVLANGNVGVGSSTPSFALEVVRTLPASPAATPSGVNFSITGAGSDATYGQTALTATLNSGYSGSKTSTAITAANNSSGGAGNGFSSDFNAVVGIKGTVSNAATVSGITWGVTGASRNSGASGVAVGIGGFGALGSSPNSIGVIGTTQGQGTTNNIGGMFTLGSVSSIASLTSAALIADNITSTSSIFLARDNSTTIFAIQDGGNVSIGSTTPSARLSIQDAYGGTQALFDIATTTSAGFATSSLFKVLANGSVGIGTSTASTQLAIESATTTATAKIFNVSTSTNGTLFNILANGTINIGSKVSFDTTGALVSSQNDSSKYIVQDADGSNYIKSGGNARFGRLGIGGDPNAANGITESYSINASTVSYGVSATVTNTCSSGCTNSGAGGFLSILTLNAAQTFANAYGLNVQPVTLSGSAVLTNNYGVYIANGTAGTNHYGLYQTDAGNNNYFAGNVGVGTTTPGSLLTVASSTATGTSSLFEVGTSTTLFKVLANGVAGVGTASPVAGSGGGSAMQVGTSNTTNQGWILGNFSSAASGIWNTGVTPSTSNFVLVSTATQTYLNTTGNGTLWFRNNNNDTFAITNGTSVNQAAQAVGWSAGGSSSALDTAMSRIAAGVIGVGTGAAGNISGTLVAGSLGAGTSTPSAKLSVQGAYGGTTPLFDVASTTSAGFATSSLFSVLANGNVGVGTATPSQKLSVNGAISFASSTASKLVAENGSIDTFEYSSNGTVFVRSFGGQSVNLNSGATIIATADTSSGLSVSSGVGVKLASGSNGLYQNGYAGSILINNAMSVFGSGASSYAGNVGIGTTTPNSRLDVWSSTSSSDVDIFRIGTSVGSANNIKFRIDSDGDIFTDGGTTIGTPADLAENYPALEAVDAGTVVAFGSTTVSWGQSSSGGTSTEQYEISGIRKALDGNEAVGVISTRAGITLGGDTIQGVPVALSGRIPVKITSENGLVVRGDFLTVSRTRPGYAMKLTDSGRSIGRAISDFIQGNDKIMMIVENGYQKVDTASKIASTTSMLTTGNLDLDANGVAIMNIKSLASANGTWSIGEDGRIVAKMLCLEDVCIDKTQLTNILNSTGQSGTAGGTTTLSGTASTTPTGEVAGASTSTSPESFTEQVSTESITTESASEPIPVIQGESEPTPDPLLSEPAPAAQI